MWFIDIVDDFRGNPLAKDRKPGDFCVNDGGIERENGQVQPEHRLSRWNVAEFGKGESGDHQAAARCSVFNQNPDTDPKQ